MGKESINSPFSSAKTRDFSLMAKIIPKIPRSGQIINVAIPIGFILGKKSMILAGKK